ncbi:MAG: hypothetical protein GX819_01420 [Clostridiaceae bacterium]|nr:hypothetical protein [Clostridiaceae bacterium]
MQYVSTRGGPPVSGIEAVCRGISRAGGLYVPESPPEPLSLTSLKGMPFQEVMAAFYHRFLPDLPLVSWEAVVRDAFRSLEGMDQVPRLPLTRLNDYLDRYFLINADQMPTGSLADLTHAVFSKLWPLLPKTEHTRLVMALLPEDSLVSLAGGETDLLKILFLSTGGARGGELAGRVSGREQVRLFEEGFDARYREFARLAAEPSFEEKLSRRGFAPLFMGPGHLLEVLTAGALATAVAASIAEFSGEEKVLDFAVAKDHLSFVAGLVYASILQIPLGTVYVGESEPASLMPLFRTGKSAQPVKRKRPGITGMDFPVNLERLFYEVTGRDGEKTGHLCQQAANPGEQLLSEDEIQLLNQSIVVGSCDYKYCLRLIRTVYDQTDYLVGRDTADAIACWAKHADQKADSAVCYVQERSPLLDAAVCARALFGKEAGRMEAIRMVSEETDVPLWPSLAKISEDSQGADWPVLTGSIEEAVYQLLNSQDAGR